MIGSGYKAKARIRVSIAGTSLQDKVHFRYQMTFYIIHTESRIIRRFLGYWRIKRELIHYKTQKMGTHAFKDRPVQKLTLLEIILIISLLFMMNNAFLPKS